MISKKRNHTQLAHTRKLEMKITALAILILASISATFAQHRCGRQANDALCSDNRCCSQYGYCGLTDAHCRKGCQSQCIAGVLGSSEFETMLLHRNDERCPAHGFYTYDAFVAAANSFPDFGMTGDSADRKRDIAAFFAHTSHDTTGGWPGAPDGEYAWGYCFFLPEQQGFPSNRKYGLPREVPQNATVSFQKALSVWMAERPPKPSCHAVMNGKWTPSQNDVENGRLPGFGLTINIINGREECGRHEEDYRAENRIGFYKRFCDILGVSYGDHVGFKDQLPFNVGRSVGNIYMQ